MGKKIQEEDAFINSLVGYGTHFKGELKLSGLFRIDGDFSGSIETKDKVLVGKRGRADCTIHAGTVVIGGVFRGSIYSKEKVVILSSALVIGNIYSPRLIVEEGVLIDGSCCVSGNAPEFAESLSPWEQKRRESILDLDDKDKQEDEEGISPTIFRNRKNSEHHHNRNLFNLSKLHTVEKT